MPCIRPDKYNLSVHLILDKVFEQTKLVFVRVVQATPVQQRIPADGVALTR